MEIKTYLRIRPTALMNKDIYEVSEDARSVTIRESLAQATSNSRKKQLSLDGPPADTTFKFD